jgi:DNA-binding IclR family transcriptional regulator
MRTRSATISYFPVERPEASAAKNQSLARGLAILQAFDDITPEAGIRELSRRLELDRSTVFRLVRTLVDAGFLEQNPVTQKYRIGPRTFEVGQRYTNSGPLYDVAARQMRALHDEHGLDVYLAVRLDGIVLYLSAIESDNVVFRAIAGTRGHLHSTSLGKMLLASEPPAVVRTILGKISLPRLTQATKTSRRALAADIAKVRKRGYATSDGENLAGVFSVSAPIRNPYGKVVAVISGSYPKAKMSNKRMAGMIAAVMRCADSISKGLGAPSAIAQSLLSPVIEISRRPLTRKRATR